ncbi:S24/S26 family peptidase [uncultured Bacteroides sp.]|uniref:S24/S26 family peptidase n=1 Tax=uncultured Bacteroides sp. TaxID=162156 RepID=UPI00280A7382|nr:S24/S26 family peptidase [uncultured Bacteroides sp.]
MQTEQLWLKNAQFFDEIDRMLQDGHSVTIRAKGSSMFPFIRNERDSVILQDSKDIAVGSIVLARLQNRSYVLHRVYRLEKEAIVLMGDGNLYATERCCRNEVVGVAVKIIRDGRYVDCTSRKELFKAWVWRKLLPVRRVLLFIGRRWWI